MLEDLDSAPEIARHTELLLRRAGADGRWPTRVDEIVQASRLSEPEESLLSRSVLLEAPKHLRRAIQRLGPGKIRALLDRRERAVYLDPAIENRGRRSFLRLHEVVHDLLPWQQDLAYADNDGTLSASTRRLFEQEANQGAAELLFQGQRFTQMAGDFRVDMAAVCQLASDVGGSLRATLRRFAETHHGVVCGLVLDPSPIGTSPMRYRRKEVSQSPSWTMQFGRAWPHVLSADAFPFLRAASQPPAAMGPMVTVWPDLDFEPVEIHAEALRNRYEILLLLWTPSRERFKRKRVLETVGTAA
jgi:hypothetical protein